MEKCSQGRRDEIRLSRPIRQLFGGGGNQIHIKTPRASPHTEKLGKFYEPNEEENQQFNAVFKHVPEALRSGSDWLQGRRRHWRPATRISKEQQK